MRKAPTERDHVRVYRALLVTGRHEQDVQVSVDWLKRQCYISITYWPVHKISATEKGVAWEENLRGKK